MNNVHNLFNTPKNVDILGELSFNGRTILTIKYDGKYALILYNLEHQPNDELRHLPYTTWGYVTYGTDGIDSYEEVEKLEKLYMNDIFSNNLWWEQNNVSL